MAVNANLNGPNYVVLDPNGNLLISDSTNNRIRKLGPAVTVSSTPTLTFLNPARILAGGSGFTMDVYGTNFAPGAVVNFNGNPRNTTYVSVNQVRVFINSFDIATPGSFPMLVVNPGSGGSSGSLTFTVFSTPAPSTNLIQTVFGSSYTGFSGDGGPALFAAFNSPTGLLRDPAGNFYVADSANNRVRKIDTNGNITTFAGTGTAGGAGNGGPAAQAQLNNPVGLARDNFGNLFISEYSGSRVRKVDSTGTITTVAGTGTPGFSGDGGPGNLAKISGAYGIATDSSGNLYIAERNNHRVRKVDTGGNISTFAGNGVAGYFGDGGPAGTTPLNEPIAIAVDLTGNVYIAEFSGNRVRRVAPDGTVYTAAGNGSTGFTGDGGTATRATVYSPLGVFVDNSGANLYIADYNNNRIRLVSGGVITTLGGNGTSGYAGDGSLANNANLSLPQFLTVDPAGNVYFTDTSNDVIREILAPPSNNPVPAITSMQPSSAQQGGASFTMLVNGTGFVPGSTVLWNTFARTTTYLSANQLSVVINNFDIALLGTQSVTVSNPTTGGGGGTSVAANFLVFPTPVASTATINTFSGLGTPGFNDSTATASQFNAPSFLTFDAQGNLYVADFSNNRVRKIAANGSVTTVAGGGATLNDGGQATSARLSGPHAVAVDGLGNMYISDFSSHRIRRVVLSSGIITTIAGNGTAGFAGDGGPAGNSQLNNPDGLALDANGNLYVAEYRNYRVRKITITNGVVGNISTVAGNGLSGYFGDGGPAVNSPLVGPASVAIDASGNLYISDFDGHRIRMVDTVGKIHLVAGTGVGAFSGDGGSALAARLNNPHQLTVDSLGNIYFADRSNNRVRKIDTSGIITTIAGTGSQSFGGDNGLAANAFLSIPDGVALDASGDVFISDTGNNRIREIGAVAGVTCLYGITPNNANFGASATTGSFTVNTTAGCFWTAASNSASLTLTSPSGNSGPGTVSFSVAANPNPTSRSATITAAGLTYTANQSGTGCNFVLNPTGATLGAGATTGNMVNVTAPNGCTFTAVSNSPFIHITSGSTGSGNGTVVYTVDANLNAQSQSGSMTIAGQVFTVGQMGAPCTYSLLTSNASYTSSGATGTISVLASPGCSWTAVSSQTWLGITSGTSGTGNGFVAYTAGANNLGVARSATITVSGTTGLIYTVNEQAFTSPVGSVSANPGTGAPGGSPRIPVVLNLPTGQLDSVSFGLSITPVAPAPAITAPLSFAADPLMPTPSISDTGTPGAISVFFSNIAPPVTGTVALGQVQFTIPASAQIGQSYTVTITGANGSSASVTVPLSAGPNQTLLLSNSYLVGDTSPLLTDLNSNGSTNDAGEFGDGLLQNLDLIFTLRQVVSIPGFTALACSDRYDAMDSYPVDTVNGRGGDGSVDNLDLITTLRRVTNIDTSRPIRGTRGLVCAESIGAQTAAVQQPDVVKQQGRTVGQLEFGTAQQNGRIPVYLRTNETVDLSALSLSVGGGEQKLTFIPADGSKPTLSDNGVRGYLALAWLDGFYAPAGRTLLGYVEGHKGGAAKLIGVRANGRDGASVNIGLPEAR